MESDLDAGQLKRNAIISMQQEGEAEGIERLLSVKTMSLMHEKHPKDVKVIFGEYFHNWGIIILLYIKPIMVNVKLYLKSKKVLP